MVGRPRGSARCGDAGVTADTRTCEGKSRIGREVWIEGNDNVTMHELALCEVIIKGHVYNRKFNESGNFMHIVCVYICTVKSRILQNILIS